LKYIEIVWMYLKVTEGAPPGVRITQKDVMEAADLDFEEQEEHWNVYKLSDGTTLKVKLILRGVKRLNKWNDDGTPLYVISAQNFVRAIDIPAKLKAKIKESSFGPV